MTGSSGADSGKELQRKTAAEWTGSDHDLWDRVLQETVPGDERGVANV